MKIIKAVQEANQLPQIGQQIKTWLERNNYDGLYNQENQCSCSLDDLLCCPNSIGKCVLARKTKCDCTGDCDFHLMPANTQLPAKEILN
jgi:hypothetical protein